MSAGNRLLYVDAAQGASGDMILGSLVDLGVSIETLRQGLENLPLAGWTLESRRLNRCALDACKVDVGVDEQHAPHRGWKELSTIIDGGELTPRVAKRARSIFRRLIEAEAKVHGRSPEQVHLHEAGGTDAIIDVVGACLALEQLDVDRVVVSRLTTGFGSVRCAHGVYPVPAPATALLVRGVPVQAGSIEAERLTPTGAAILTTLAEAWGPMPPLRPLAIGYGAGDRDLGDTPNMLRMVLGQAESGPETAAGDAEVAVIECNLDDATPQAVAFVAERLREAGALDVVTTAVVMKKGRSGHLLTVLARPEDLLPLTDQILRETSTLGLRYRFEQRRELRRSVRTVDTPFGRIDVKLGELDGRVVQAWPEYEQCAAIARREGLPLERVQRAALTAYGEPEPTDP